jgi:hypothetical protein
MLPERDYRRFQSRIWDYGARLAAIWKADPGNMPYGRYRGQPVAVALRDPDYVAYLESRWEAGLPDPPEMIAEFRRLVRRRSGCAVLVEHRGGCAIYAFPSARIARHHEPPEAA